MRILYWTANDLRQHGGGTTHVLEVVRHLDLQGHTVTLCTPFPVPRLESSAATRSHRIRGFGPKFLQVLWFELLALAAVPYLRWRRECDVVYSRFSLLAIFMPVICRLMRVPYVAEFNGLSGQELAMMGRGSSVVRFADWVDRLNFRLAHRCVCVTEGIRASLIAATHRPPEASCVIGNGVDGDVFRPLDKLECRARLGMESDGFWVGFVGSLARWQGVEQLIEAVRILHDSRPDIRALIVGDGAMKSELEAFAADSVSIRFVGRVPHVRVPMYLGAVDVAYLCKRGLAGGFSPLKAYEYLAAGRPIICNRAEGLVELVSSDRGFLFDADDPATLLDALRASMEEPERLLEMGVSARALALESHSWAAVARQTTRVLDDARRVAAGR